MKSKNRLGAVLAALMAGVVVFGLILPGSVQGATFPEKGKTISIIVPSSPGGGTDLSARLLASMLEVELGVSVQVVNKPGAGFQRGLTEIARSKPDGYTLGATPLPTAIPSYLDPERHAVYTRTDFVPIATQYDVGYVIGAHKASPYKTLSDLVAAAKAQTNTIKVGTTGLMASGHLSTLQFQKVAGVRFVLVHFDGAAPQVTALLGQHVDVIFTDQVGLLPHFKAGTARALAVLQKEESPSYPRVKTAAAQGYAVFHSVVGTICGPKGISQGAVAILSSALRKIINSDEHKQKMKELGFPVRYLNPQETAELWADTEAEIRPFVEEALRTK